MQGIGNTPDIQNLTPNSATTEAESGQGLNRSVTKLEQAEPLIPKDWKSSSILKQLINRDITTANSDQYLPSIKTAISELEVRQEEIKDNPNLVTKDKLLTAYQHKLDSIKALHQERIQTRDEHIQNFFDQQKGDIDDLKTPKSMDWLASELNARKEDFSSGCQKIIEKVVHENNAAKALEPSIQSAEQDVVKIADIPKESQKILADAVQELSSMGSEFIDSLTTPEK
ncbi:hypothetical protein CI610_00604 [invertebrate metagenome]|uniref:Uncharacterized protein n=1 Tax=invertebrate metagenome TaxID=1711999 RepID=A0A2H9TB07_9ZZZZ